MNEWNMIMEINWNDTDREYGKYSKKSMSRSAMYTTKPTWTGLGLNSDLRFYMMVSFVFNRV